jgi:hypothetical protein
MKKLIASVFALSLLGTAGVMTTTTPAAAVGVVVKVGTHPHHRRHVCRGWGYRHHVRYCSRGWYWRNY